MSALGSPSQTSSEQQLTGLSLAEPIPALMRVNDFCRRFAIGRTKFYEEVKRGNLNTIKVHGSTRVTAEDALAWRDLYANSAAAAEIGFSTA